MDGGQWLTGKDNTSELGSRGSAIVLTIPAGTIAALSFGKVTLSLRQVKAA